MKNPKWHRDEIILALDLYFRIDRGRIDAGNPEIIELSHILNCLPIHEEKPDPISFRNPNGVCLKLSNFIAIDPDHPGKGMTSYSKQDASIFFEFQNNRRLLSDIAAKIKNVIRDSVLNQNLSYMQNDTVLEDIIVREGDVLYRLHRLRERNPAIVRKKRAQYLQKNGKLSCEICSFDFEKTYGSLGQGFIECHHTVPLSSLDTAAETKLADLILVCANCHRMLHRNCSIEELRRLMEKNRG